MATRARRACAGSIESVVGARDPHRDSTTAGDRPSPVIKSLWAAVQGDPVFMRRVNGWLAVAWVAMIPISYELGWLNSVVYVSSLSLWALVSGHWSAWQAARVEVKQDEAAQ